MFATLRACLVTERSSEGLVEPQVIPPLHSHKVTEPHVAQLVLNDHAEESQLWDRHVLLRAHDLVRVRDTSDILHGAIFVIRAHHVVHLCEWISSTEVLLVKVNRRLCDAKHELVPQELDEGLAHEDALGHIHRVVVLEDLVGTRADGVEISRNLGGLLELIDGNFAFIFVEWEEPFDAGALQDMFASVSVVARFDGVRDSLPILWAEDN